VHFGNASKISSFVKNQINIFKKQQFILKIEQDQQHQGCYLSIF